MKNKIILNTMTAALLMTSSVFAAPVKVADIKDVFEKHVVKEKMTSKNTSEVASDLSRVAGTHIEGTLLNKNIKTSTGDVSLNEIATSLIKSAKVINDTKLISTERDSGAQELLAAIGSSNQAYAEALTIIAPRIKSAEGTTESLAVSKVLLMGKEIAQGKMDAKQAKSYDDLVRAMVSLIRQGQAHTAEEALDKAIEGLGMDKEQKKKELANCV